VGDQRVDEAQEDLRVLGRRAARLGGVGAIVAPGADDLVGIGDRRQQGDLRQRDVGRGALAVPGGAFEDARGEGGAQGRIGRAEPAAEIDDRIADQDAIRRMAGRGKADQFHDVTSLSGAVERLVGGDVDPVVATAVRV
jgi:hypothetical protein